VNVGIVGCGLIGNRRAREAQAAGDRVLLVADVHAGRAREIASAAGTNWTEDWRDVARNPQIDVVVVSTVNKYLLPITLAALENGKHVLCEKPPGRNVNETRRMVDAASKNGTVLKIGFNHRHHPAIRKAHELCSRGEIGPIMFIRAVYGHGGRPGYEKEWRADADLAGGGELLDQGVHLIDLCRWFLSAGPEQESEFTQAFGLLATSFWDLGYYKSANEQMGELANMRIGKSANPPASQSTNYSPATQDLPIYQLEDNAFITLRTPTGQIAQLHTSWTQWRNRFTFELFGADGYLIIDGLGGSYGPETLTIGRRRPESGPPEEERLDFPGPDLSWQAEWQEFTSAIREGRQPLANGEDGLKTMLLVDAIYRSARSGQIEQI
jgi:predicted dehydrogenase